MSSALASVHTALVAVLNADAQLNTALVVGTGVNAHKVFFGRSVPAGVSAPYVLLLASVETNADAFAKEGNVGAVDYRIGTRDESGYLGKVIHGHIVRVLHGKPLTLTDHVLTDGTVEYVTDYGEPDPNPPPTAALMHHVGRYRPSTWSVAA